MPPRTATLDRETRTRIGTPLRRRLFVLTAACILPIAVMSGISLWALKRQQNAQNDVVGLELARSVANAVDAELRRSMSILETLATSPGIDAGDFAGFLERSRRVNRLWPDWTAIVLADPSGRVRLDTRYPLGSALPPDVDPASFRDALRAPHAVVGNLTRDATGAWVFPMRTAVLRGGEVRYVLTALLQPIAIRDLLVRQRVPADWVISVVDARGLRVARSRAHEENLGGRLSPTVQRVVDRGGADGVGIAFALEGERILTPYSRVGSTGWIAVLGIPTALLDAAAFRSIAVYGGGIVASILLGVFGGLWVTRTITRPIAALRSAAEALGRGEPPQPPATSIQEIREVGASLRAAGNELAAGEVARAALLHKERRAREAAETADRAKDEFLAVVSHELRTPLNAVYGWARMLQSGRIRDDATIAKAMDAIVRNSDIQVQLIDDLLDLSRITSGKMRLNVLRVALDSVVQGALDAVRPAADAKGIDLRAELDPDIGSMTADPGRLQQVVWNLLMNAVKFTPRGGEVRLEAGREDSTIRIVVRDTGQGIAADMLPHVFERFRQADSSSTRAHGGLGLGLALVKHLVELHGGTVGAESAGEGRGATFTVTLPIVPVAVRPDAPADARPARAVTVGSGGARLDGMRVLVADDDPEGLALVEAILARAGAEVRACASADEAFAALRAWRPTVLLSDIGMPEADGYSLIRRVRAMPAAEGGATPAIALTGFGRPQDRQRAMAAGFERHVPKPVDPEELTRLIASLAGGDVKA